MYDILVLVIALALFTLLAFLRVGALPLASIVALVTCLLAGLPVLDTLLGPFMSSAAGYVQSYCFVFFLGAVFSALRAVWWWLRSARYNTNSNFCSVDAGGDYNSNGASWSAGVVAGFCDMRGQME